MALNDVLEAALVAIADAAETPAELLKTRVAEHDLKTAKLKALELEDKFEWISETDEKNREWWGRYHLEKSIRIGEDEIEFIDFRKPTIGDWRKLARYSGIELGFQQIVTLSRPLKAELLERVSADDFDDMVEVAGYPFERRPGGPPPPTARSSEP